MKRIYFTHAKEASLFRRVRNATTRGVSSAAMKCFPQSTVKIAERLLCVTSPPRRKLLDLPFSVTELDVYDQRIKMFAAGSHKASVLFVHGWSGSSADFNAFYQPVLDAGLNVIAIDHVAHGASPGKLANMFLFVRAIEEVLARDELNIKSVVAHSMGGAAVISAMKPEGNAMPVTLISPVIPFFESLYQSVDNFGISTTWVDELLALCERRYARSIDEIDPKVTMQRFVNPVLTIQDKQDRHVPLETNKQLFTPHLVASLHETDGLGHFKILGAEEVVNRAIQFAIDMTHRQAG